MKFNQLNLLTQMMSLSLLLIPAIIQVDIFSFNTLIQPHPFSQRSEPFSDEGSEGGSQLWRKFFPRSEPVPEEGGNGGSRGDGFCPISPYQFSEVEPILNNRPTFTWKGNITQIEIREQNSQTVVWSQDISEENRVNLNLQSDDLTPLKLYQIAVETALQPGQVYELYVSTNPPIDYRPIPFRILTTEERNAINQELQQLEQKLAAENITGDAAILQRADYFASQQLWSEFWQEVLSVETPSEDLKQLINQTVNRLCR
ncbi:MAG: hypothetical protein WBA13_17330 [Microcoleaceae cyanobacterium]